MNILTSKFPTKIKIDEKIYPINCDYRNCLKIIMAFEDDELTYYEKISIMLKKLYEEIPDNQDEAVNKAILFLDCGKEDKTITNDSKRSYRFDRDSQYIYSAVRKTHNIDLEDVEYLHWWKFVFLFMDTGKDCMFNNFIYLRQKKNEGKLTKEEKKIWIEMRSILDLEYSDEEPEEESEFIKEFNQG